MIKIEDALQHLGYDTADNVITARVQRALNGAEKIVQGAVGEDVFDLLPDDGRTDELVLHYLDELYDRCSTSAKVGPALQRLTDTMEMQLRLELRRMREADHVR